MIHSPLTRIYQKFSRISEEKKLALKISGVSFLVLVGILTVIIATSYFAQSGKIYGDFHNEISIFEGGQIGKNIRDVLGDSGRNIQFPMLLEHPGGKEFRGPRDVIIFDQHRDIVKNDYLDLDTHEVNSLYELTESGMKDLEIDGRTYIIYKRNIGNFTLFLTRDITQLIEFHTWLMALAALGSIIGLVVIYTLALTLARIMIEPIRAHNTALEGYSHNVAHELKTPLAVMRSNMELLRLSQSENLIESTSEEIASMERTIDTLLLMANPKKHYTKIEKIDLQSLTEEIRLSYDPSEVQGIYQKKQIKIEGNSELYKRVLTNLIDNALKYKSS